MQQTEVSQRIWHCQHFQCCCTCWKVRGKRGATSWSHYNRNAYGIFPDMSTRFRWWWSILICRPCWKIMPYNTYKTTNVFCVCNLEIPQLIFFFNKCQWRYHFHIRISIPVSFNFHLIHGRLCGTPWKRLHLLRRLGTLWWSLCFMLRLCGGSGAPLHSYGTGAGVGGWGPDHPGGQTESQWQGGCLQLRGRWMKMIQWFRWKWLAIFVLWRDWLKKCKCGRLWQHFDGVEKVPVTRVLGKHRQHWFMILKNDPVWLAKEVILLVIKDGGSVY